MSFRPLRCRSGKKEKVQSQRVRDGRKEETEGNARVLGVIVPDESVVVLCDVGRDRKFCRVGLDGPEALSEYGNADVDCWRKGRNGQGLRVSTKRGKRKGRRGKKGRTIELLGVVRLLHLLVELVAQVLAEVHVCVRFRKSAPLVSLSCPYSQSKTKERNSRGGRERTGKHSLQLARVLKPGGLLELGDHTRLGLVRDRERVDEPLREHLGIELLEDILVLEVLEDGHLTKECRGRGGGLEMFP